MDRRRRQRARARRAKVTALPSVSPGPTRPTTRGGGSEASPVARMEDGGMAEKRLQTILNVLSLVLIAMLVASFTAVIRAALSAS